METVRDFNSIISSPPFTFLVGKSHIKITIQSALAKHVSRPLDHLMNNGHTRESKHRIAVLEDEEVEVFVAFCEYAYTSDYTVPPQGREPEPQLSGPWNNMVRTHSTASWIPPPVPSPPPLQPLDLKSHGNDEALNESPGDFTEQSGKQEEVAEDVGPVGEEEDSLFSSVKKPKKDRKSKKRGRSTIFFDEAAPTSLTPPSTPPLQTKEEGVKEEGTKEDNDGDIAVETDPDDSPTAIGGNNWYDQPVSPHSGGQNDGYDGEKDRKVANPKQRAAPIIDTSFASQSIAAPRNKGVSAWDEFAALEYDYRPPSVDPVTSKPDVPYILFHAKLYVFATRFLMSGLAQLCLKKLHNDLLSFVLIPPSANEEEDLNEDEADIFDAGARMILDVLRYTYSRTARFEPESPTSATLLRESELRKLVTQYAACKMRELAAYTPVSIPVPSSPSHGPGSGASMIAAPGGGLRELLDATPELASDLVYRMM